MDLEVPLTDWLAGPRPSDDSASHAKARAALRAALDLSSVDLIRRYGRMRAAMTTAGAHEPPATA